MRVLCRLLTLTVLALGLLAAPARGGYVAGEVLDGPSAGIGPIGGLEVARDGTGGLGYLRDGRATVSVLGGGRFGPPVAVDPGLPAAAGPPALAASDAGSLVAAWIAGGAVYAAYRPPGVAEFGAPVLLWGGAGVAPATSVAADLSLTQKGFVVFAAGGDVRAARLRLGGWSLTSGPLDADPARTAGAGTGRPQVSVAADTTPVVVWGEAGQIFARRIDQANNPSVAVLRASPDSVGGRPAGEADLPTVATGDDSSFALVAWRQQFTDGGSPVSRSVTRRLRGGAFDDPATFIDGLAPGAGEVAGGPLAQVASNGGGLALTPLSTRVAAAAARGDGLLAPGGFVDAGGGVAAPVVAPAVSRAGGGFATWIQTGASGIDVRVRPWDPASFGPEQPLAAPDIGPVLPELGLGAGTDRTLNLAMAWVQGAGAERRLVFGGFDQPPRPPGGRTPKGFGRDPQPTLAWRAGGDLWGGTTSRIELDGVTIATGLTTTTLRVPLPLADGPHSWRVISSDSRGQETAGPVAGFTIDTVAPTGALSVAGRLVTGRPIRFSATGSDGATPPTGGAIPGPVPAPPSAGVRTLSVLFGDGSKPVNLRRSPKPASAVSGSTLKTFTRPGRYLVTLSVLDAAGNPFVVEKRIRVTKPKPKPRPKPKPKPRQPEPERERAARR